MRSFLAVLLVCLVSFAPAFAQRSDEYNKEQKKGYDALMAGKLDEGIASMKRCLELSPEDPTSAYNLACGYSLKKELDTAFEWLNKSFDWGFGFSQLNNITHPDGDKDLDNLRADPRYAAAMERVRGQAKKAEEYYSVPIVYVPAALATAETKPLLVVLHAEGSTKDMAFEKGPWKKLADDLGTALIVPSARVPMVLKPEVAPAQGMTWFGFDYATATAWKYEKPVNDAVDAFKKEHKIDPTRVYIVGEGQGAMVAFNIAVTKPGFYKGVIAISGLPNLQLAQAKLPNAIKAGQRSHFALDAQPYTGGGDTSKIDETAKLIEDSMKKAGMAVTFERFEKKPDDPAQSYEIVAKTLKAFATPAPAAQPAEAGADKK